MAKIMRIAAGVDVVPLLFQIERNPSLWGAHRQRLELYGSPHTAVDDIWVRYNAIENYAGDMAAFNAPHDSVWYPAIEALPAAREIALSLMARVRGERLGGVLITRIPPGEQVAPHSDHGWHAGYYDKFAVQLKSAPGQAFCFEGEALDAAPGEVYWFDNSHTHWVVNPTDDERMTMIVCIKGG